MTFSSYPPTHGRCHAHAHLCAAVLVLFTLAILGMSASPAFAADSPAAGRVNIGTLDDPYFVDDVVQLDALKASAIAQSSMAAAINVVRLNTWATGLTHTTPGGVNRLNVIVVAYENGSDVSVSAVTYGGQALTRIGGAVNSSGTRERTEIWYLDEAGIALAGSSTYAVTWGGSAPTSPKYSSATFGNVDQTSPIVDHNGNSDNDGSPNPMTTTVTVVAGGMSLSGIMNGNTGSFTWNNSYIEGTDQSGSSSNLSVADRSEAVAGSATPSATHSSATRRAMYSASLRPAASAGALDSINIGQIDPSLFPQICAYFEALDAGGNPVGDLPADSFCVYQDSIRLDVFSIEQLTVDSCNTATCLVIDVSGSMSGANMTAAKAAASGFIRNMDTFDRAAVVSFSSCYTVVQNFTSDTTLLLNAVAGLVAGGTTAHFDAVYAGVNLTIPELGSKAVINLTDGLENASSGCGGAGTPDGLGDGFADDSTLIVNLAMGAGIPIYSITLGSGFDPQYAQKMAFATGGAYYHAPNPAQLDGIYEQIKERLCTRYKICYTSPDTIQNGDCHDVVICQQSMPDVCVNCDTAEYCEKAPPIIIRTPPTIALDTVCQPWNTAVQLCAYVTDEDTPLNALTVTMFYRPGNVGAFTSVPTTRTDSTFCANVPASALVCGGDSIQYYFTASDGSVTVASPSNAPAGRHAFPICPNLPPVCNVPNDTTITQCTPTQVCLPVSATDPNGNLTGCVKMSGPGTLMGGQWCYTPAGSETVNITIRCTDACGLYCEETFSVTFAVNAAPVCNAINDTTVFQCTPTQFCRPVGATDPNGNLVGCAVQTGPGTVSGGNWCYTPSGDEVVSVTIRCTDACGAFCDETFQVTFQINDAPVCTPINDTTYFQCAPAQVCRPVGATDPNGNFSSCAVLSGPGTVSGGNWCYTPAGDETVNVTIRCTDACGAFCDESFSVTFNINEAPVCNAISDTTYFQCAPVQVCRPVGATDADGNFTSCAVVSGPGSVSGGNWCYTPVGDETVNVTIRCTDACGAFCDETFSVTFQINEAPVCTPVADTSFFQCAPAQVCLPVSASDADGNFSSCAIISGPGTLSAGNWCYTPVGDETVNVTVRCTDACGAFCDESFSVTFSINDAPTCNTVSDTTYFQCAPTQVCRPVGASDANGNFSSCAVISGPGTVSGGNWCYTPVGDETVNVTIRCTDACGAFCDEPFSVTFQINDAPVCTPVNDTTYSQCAPTQVCRAVSATDANGNLSGCAVLSGPGTVSGGNWCYTPAGDETVNVTIRCTDACGAFCDESFSVTFLINDAPICSTPNDTTIFQCAPAQVCLPVSASDANGNLSGCAITNGPGTLSGGNWCYTPAGDGTVNVTIRCTDACGAFCEETFSVTFQINEAPVCDVPDDTAFFQCVPTQVCLPVSASDADGNFSNCVVLSGPGSVSGGNWCYTPSGDEVAVVTIRCTDACGAFCDASFSVEFDLNDAPVIDLGPDQGIAQNFDGDTVCLSYSVSDPEGFAGLLEALVSSDLSIVYIDTLANQVCFVPDAAGLFAIVASVTDPCGASDVDTLFVIINETLPPLCQIPDDTTLTQCAPTEICLGPIFATSMNGPTTCEVFSGPGVLGSDSNWCYTPTGDTTFEVVIRCYDTLGSFCSDAFTVTIDINDEPVCDVPNDTTIFQCAPTEICLPVSATDLNLNLDNCEVVGGVGEVIGGMWCYTPGGGGDKSVDFPVTIRCTDSCGEFCEASFTVTVVQNEAPVCNVPNDTTIFLCAPVSVCLPVSASDVDGNLSGCSIISGPGTLNGNWCYTPGGDEVVSVTIECVDACGATCEQTFNVTFVIDDAPVCSVPNDTSIFQCAPMQVCLPVSATDADGNLVDCDVIAGPGAVAGGSWCYTPVASGTVNVTIECTDACGASCQETFSVTFNVGNPPQITCPGNLSFTCASLVTPCNPADATIIGGAGTVNVSCSRTDNGGLGCAASPLIYTDTYTATDSCGAQAQCSRTITVIDNVAPTLVGCPGNVTISCDDPVPPPAAVTATDNCDPSVTPVLVETPNLAGCGGYSGTITRVWTATDDCGNVASCTQIITVQDTEAPVCNIPSGPFTYFQCTPTQISIPVSAVDNCDATPACAVVVGPGAVVGGNWVYTPVGDASFSVTIRCTDDCNNSCEGSFNVSVQVNDPPVIAFGADLNLFQCSPAQICVNYTTNDPNGLGGSIEALVSGPAGATLNAGANQVCFTPGGAGAFTIVASLMDSCGLIDYDTINVVVSANSAPSISFGPDRAVFQCNAEQICVDYTASDPNGNALTEALIAGPGGAILDQVLNRVCFTPPTAGLYTIVARVQDTCGAIDYDTVNVTVTRNLPPVAVAPNDTSVSQCENATVCLPVSGTDPEGKPLTITKVSGPGTISNGQWCYTAGSDIVAVITFRVTDSCGAFDDASFTVTFDLNDPPQCQVPGDMTIHQNCIPQQVSIPVGAFDPDGNLTGCQIIAGPGTLIDGNWVYTPMGNGQVCVTIRCTDACGETCQQSFCVYFDIDEDLCNCLLVVSIGDGDGTIQALNGQQVTVPVNIDSVAGPIGGFDFLICYDPSVLTFLHTSSGEAIEDWEYFTYRYGPNGNCGGACPAGYVRLVGIANLNNGINPPESAYYPIGSIAELVFQISPDRNLINQCVPINFCWVDCGDNTMSSRSGDTTWVDHLMIVDTCQSNAKVNPIPGICFSTGYICIMEPPDDRGDLNLNGIANEVGDAVLFTNYFIYGSSVWDPAWTEVQILASDVNDDGIVLTVADLIYLIRIITGDEQPFPPGTGTGSPKLSPYMNSASAIIYTGDEQITISTSSSVDLGGALLVFRYTDMAIGQPTLLEGGLGMTLRSNATSGELRVLVHPSWQQDEWAVINAGTREIFSIPTSGNGTIELVGVQFSDAHGALLSTSMAKSFVPTDYELLQNYPNPFNAGTVITFNLKEASEWKVAIYNVMGQVVRSFEGSDDASSIRVSWDGRDRDGATVASGVYFYRVTTPEWNATRKMTLVR